jgi:lysyl-tRNA synthetase class 2
VVSAVLPPAGRRLAWLAEMLPEVSPQGATAASLAVGLLLVPIARGLRRRKRRAWVAAVVLLAASMVLHLLRERQIGEVLLAAALLGVLWVGRREFTAVAETGTRRRALTALLVLLVVDMVVGLSMIGARALAEPADVPARLWHVLTGLVGLPGPVQFVSRAADTQVSLSLAALGLLTVGAPLVVFLRSPRGGPARAAAQEARLRALVGRYGGLDSLGYFGLRADKAVVFAPSGKAAVAYRVVGGVSLAAGDPIGDPEAWPAAIDTWLDEARRHAWTPAVLGCSEAGAEVLARFGLDAWELGDEAILEVPGFTLEGRAMRSVRQAVARVERAGYRAEITRVAELDAPTAQEVQGAARGWRGEEIERGFSMALGRLADPVDPDNVVAVGRDGTGSIRGVLQFVPWGPTGLSLDVMGRDRCADNGLVELLVTSSVRWCAERGVDRLSLNFAVARSVFARGERIGSGPMLRLTRRLLLFASRFWQLESLYRANAKYRPIWEPRYLVFPTARDVPSIAVAALRAEAFLIRPRPFRRHPLTLG